MPRAVLREDAEVGEMLPKGTKGAFALLMFVDSSGVKLLPTVQTDDSCSAVALDSPSRMTSVAMAPPAGHGVKRMEARSLGRKRREEDAK